MIWQDGIFPLLVELWNHKHLSSAAVDLVSDLLLSLLQPLPAYVASSLLPTGDLHLTLTTMPAHWQVLATQPSMLDPVKFQDAVISSNIKVFTAQLPEVLQSAAVLSGHD